MLLAFDCGLNLRINSSNVYKVVISTEAILSSINDFIANSTA